jgi:hypothetical protein
VLFVVKGTTFSRGELPAQTYVYGGVPPLAVANHVTGLFNTTLVGLPGVTSQDALSVGAIIPTSTLAVASDAPLFLHRILYVVGTVIAETVSEVGPAAELLLPDQPLPPLAVHDDGLPVVVHLKVGAVPELTGLVTAVKVTEISTTVTTISLETLVVPFEQVMVYFCGE